MRIQPVGMWVTPASQEELTKLVEGLNSPEAYHAMMFTWNYLASVINKDHEENSNAEETPDI